MEPSFTPWNPTTLLSVGGGQLHEVLGLPVTKVPALDVRVHQEAGTQADSVEDHNVYK